jgi:NAD dependent epimerase/dehydratase family enzyme
MKKKLNAVILGSTGEVGSILLKKLIKSENYNKITTITRKPLEIKDQKIKEIIINFENFQNEIKDHLKDNEVSFR